MARRYFQIAQRLEGLGEVHGIPVHEVLDARARSPPTWTDVQAHAGRTSRWSTSP
ncbi:MAG: hypothetical protein U0166_05065 [Acidobacteriota bacterium]